jgi:hypothetical protein
VELTLNVEVPEPPGTVVGEMDALRLEEDGKALRSTGAENPSNGEIVIVEVVEIPALNVKDEGLEETVKSGPMTLTGM